MQKLTATQIAIIQHIMQLKFSGSTHHAVFTPIPGTEDDEAVTMDLRWFRVDTPYILDDAWTGKMRCYLNGMSTTV